MLPTLQYRVEIYMRDLSFDKRDGSISKATQEFTFLWDSMRGDSRWGLYLPQEIYPLSDRIQLSLLLLQNRVSKGFDSESKRLES